MGIRQGYSLDLSFLCINGAAVQSNSENFGLESKGELSFL